MGDINNTPNKSFFTIDEVKTEIIKIFDEKGKEIFKGSHAELVSLIKRSYSSYTTTFVPHSSGTDWMFSPMTATYEIKVPDSK